MSDCEDGELQGSDPQVAAAAAAPAQRPATPLGWFEGGAWARLDEKAVVWAGHGLLTLPMPLFLGYWLWNEGLGILELFGGVFLGVLLFAWSFNWAFASLRRAVRPTTGSLAQLVASSPNSGDGGAPSIAEESRASLVRWRRGAYGVAALWALANVAVWLPITLHEIATGQLMHVAARVLFLLNLAGIGPLFAAWYVSLRLGCALAREDAERSSPAPNAATLPAAEWERTVRGPMMAVADETMPVLSEWGEPLAALTAGLLCLALGVMDAALRLNALDFFAPMLVPLLLAIPSLWLVPATVSTTCERMTESLNDLRKHSEAGNQFHISTLEAYLKGRNHEQGVGFEVHGTTLNRTELKTLVGKTYAGMAFLWVLFGPETGIFGDGLVDLNDANGLCNEGWAYADGSCFRAFGVSVELVGAEETAEWKAWPEAEGACQAFGGHLAVILSQAQQDTAAALSEGLIVWIGANDQAEEGSFVWSDGEPLGAYENWWGAEPNDHPTLGSCEGGTEDCSVLQHNGQWADSACSFHPYGNFTSRADLGSGTQTQHEGIECTEVRLPYICSKSPIPCAACSCLGAELLCS